MCGCPVKIPPFTANVFLFPSSLQREGVPAQPQGSASEGGGKRNARVLEIGTASGGGVAHDLLTGDVQGEENCTVFSLALWKTNMCTYLAVGLGVLPLTFFK